ncbi:MAG TPA: hypothetical protein VH592_05710 [Gemmataceae bacterium]
MKKVPLLLISVLLIQPPAVLHADGGAVRLSKQIGNYRITVFTSPVPLRAGPVDISVFVQDTATGGPVSEARITVRASPRELPESSIIREATTDAATNKLFQAAVFDLTQPGWWDVQILIDGLNDPIGLQFQMELSEALPGIWQLAPWICWPAVVVALFCVHKWLVERKQRELRRIKKAGFHNREPALVTLSPNQRNSV